MPPAFLPKTEPKAGPRLSQATPAPRSCHLQATPRSKAAPAAPLAPSRDLMVRFQMAQIHLVLGPVGAGKSTYAQALKTSEPAAFFDLDEWMAQLFGDDPRPDSNRMEWYLERRDRVLKLIWQTALQVLEAGGDVILELGLIRRRDRDAFFGQVSLHEFPVTMHLLDAPRELRRARVVARNAEKGPTFSMTVPLEVFEMASDMWEPLAPDELEGHTVHYG